MIRLLSLLLVLLLAGCTSATQDYWHSDRIIGASSRLLYSNPRSHLKMELLKLEEGVTAFLLLDGLAFDSPHLRFTIDGQTLSETAHLRKGQMRLKLSPETTRQIISALQDGREIDILTSGFEEKISSGDFEKAYRRFLAGHESLLNRIKGPIE